MAFNVRSGGRAESVPVPNTVVSGNVVRVGSLVGIAEKDAAVGDDGLYYTTLALEGIAHASISSTVAVGDALYTTTAGPGAVTLTKTSAAGARPIGIATRAKASSSAGEVWFKLVPTVVNATA